MSKPLLPASAAILAAAELDLVTVTNLKAGNILTQQSIDAGVQARIIYPPDIAEGDEINFFWGINQLQKYYESGPIAWVINIKTAFLPSAALSDGNYAVYYNINDVFGNSRTSPQLDVTVQGSSATQPTLLSPDVLYAGTPVNIINIARSDDISIRIPVQAGAIADEDVVKVYLRVTNRTTGALISLSQVADATIEDATAPTVIAIPGYQFNNLDSVLGNFYYEIVKDVTGAQAYSRTTAVWIDTVAPGA
ncbi:hypothetical protein SJI19_08125 [Acerihabitans sp. TG2]|uniref:hypothetical protein n=1 Tax=Acerihabitans sp. TG2 TaxID=3096008 RepID=UPI002B2335D4|nr:hypothetical protein [Acerihabitans sp. TG2]MEA9390506.1 hypothetical protein [Acerihabitans sp. TG2]